MVTLKTAISMDEKTDSSTRSRFTTSLYKISPIHGFGFIAKSRNRIETSFWTLLMAIFVIILAKDVYSLFYHYKYTPNLTKVTMNFNESINTTDMAFCIYLVSDDIPWENSSLKNMSFDLAVQSALADYTSKEKFLDSEWDPAIKKAARDYFREMTYWENYEGDINVTKYKDFEKKNSKMRAIELLEKHIFDIGVTQREMFDKMGKYLRELVNLKVQYNGQKRKTYYNHKLSWAWNVICFHMELPKTLTNPADKFKIYGDVAKIETNRRYNFRTIKMSFERKKQVQDEDPLRIHMLVRERRVEDIEIAGLYKNVHDANEKEKFCESTIHKADCMELCRSTKIKEKCNCVPFTKSDYEPDTKKVCKMSDYLACLAYEAGELKCSTPCLPPCQMYTYRTNTKYTAKEKKYRFSIEFSYGNFVYPSFEEHQIVYYQHLLASFGGTLGVYFGASFLSLIHIVFYGVKTAFDKYIRKKEAPVVLYVTDEHKGSVIKWGCPSPRGSIQRLEIPKSSLATND